MPKPTKGPRLGGSSSHQAALLANLATALFEHGRIKTTEPKARALRPYAEKLITHAKKGTLHNRREVMKKIRDKDVVHSLFAEIGPFFADRNGGYTRILMLGPRNGDGAAMVLIELVDGSLKHRFAPFEPTRAPAGEVVVPRAERGRLHQAHEIHAQHLGLGLVFERRVVTFEPRNLVAFVAKAATGQLLGFPRHLSQHTGGMVMTRGPLCEMVPIENASMDDRTVIEWDKDDLDALGILKVDCLALGMLTAIRKCFDLVERHPERPRRDERRDVVGPHLDDRDQGQDDADLDVRPRARVLVLDVPVLEVGGGRGVGGYVLVCHRVPATG